jgi:hypothetical protein
MGGIGETDSIRTEKACPHALITCSTFFDDDGKNVF